MNIPTFKTQNLGCFFLIFLIVGTTNILVPFASSSTTERQLELQISPKPSRNQPISNSRTRKTQEENSSIPKSEENSIPPVTAENVTSFISPDSSYKALSSEIRHAQEEIYILMYQFYHPQLFSTLKDAVVNRDVSLTIVLENDTGWRGSTGSSDQYNRYYAEKFYNLSKNHDVNVYLEREWRYLHAKLVVIDNETSIVMSANMVPASIPSDLDAAKSEYKTLSRQWGCIIHGAEASDQYLQAVNHEIKYQAKPYNPQQDGTGDQPEFDETLSYSQSFSMMSLTDVSFNPILSPNNSFEIIMDAIKSADHLILIQLMYIAIGAYESNKVNQLVEALGNAVDRGVTVMALLEEDIKDNYNEAKPQLENKGIHVIPANSTDTYPLFIHNKGLIIDDQLVVLGSVNWSDNSIDNNRETGALIRSPGIARWFKNVLEQDWNRTERVFDDDGDGLPTIFEEEHDFNPDDPDSDGDGISDYEEVFEFDTVAPSVNITHPRSDETIENSNVTIEWEGTDDTEIHHYEIRLNMGTWKDVMMNTSYRFTNLTDGSYNVTVKAIDQALNSVEATVSFTIKTGYEPLEFTMEQIILIGVVLIILVILIIYISKKRRE